MTAEPEAAASASGRAPSPYDMRLVANVPTDIGTRLRLLAALRRKPVGHVLTELLGRELPTSGQLAAQLQQMEHVGARDDRADH